MAAFTTFALTLTLVVPNSIRRNLPETPDPWSPGVRLQEWHRIETIQRFPLYDAEPQFEWAAACRDESWLVRGAAAIAAGRAPELRLVDVLRPMLRDESPFVRHSALDALLKIESPLAGGRAFGVDDARRLVAWDPFRAAGVTVAQLSQPERDFMPLDHSRVFVALDDGTAVLIEDGKDKPVWRRPFSLGINSFLAASPQVITAADEDGTLHALDPRTGDSLWSRKVRGGKWLDSRWQSHRGLIRPAGELLLVPNQPRSPTSFEAVERASGETRWTHRSEFPIAKLACGPEAALLAGQAGELVLLSLADGSIRWKKRMEASVNYPDNELSVTFGVSSDRAFVGLKETLWALDAADGAVLWTWRWNPLPREGKLGGRGIIWPSLCPSNAGLYCVLNWETEGHYNDRADVILLDNNGKLVFHATSPHPPYRTNLAHEPIVSDDAVAFRKDHRWEVWRFDENQAPRE
jgi:hypothetical protein